MVKGGVSRFGETLPSTRKRNNSVFKTELILLPHAGRKLLDLKSESHNPTSGNVSR